MRRRLTWGLVLAAVVFRLAARAAEDAPAVVAPTPEPARIHASGNDFERKVLDAIRACLREDSTATVAALDGLDAACRRLVPNTPGVSHGILVYDQALHISLAKSRELADRGDMAKAFDELVWVTRQCFNCHTMARKEGRMPAEGPDGGSQTRSLP